MRFKETIKKNTKDIYVFTEVVATEETELTAEQLAYKKKTYEERLVRGHEQVAEAEKVLAEITKALE